MTAAGCVKGAHSNAIAHPCALAGLLLVCTICFLGQDLLAASSPLFNGLCLNHWITTRLPVDRFKIMRFKIISYDAVYAVYTVDALASR